MAREMDAQQHAGVVRPGPDPLLRLSGVSKRYGYTQALDGADLTLAPAEIVGLVGHNGAGKSTLMRVITGITRPDEGRMEFAGRAVGEDFNLGTARALGIRIAFQELSLSPALAVFENVLVSRPSLRGPGWRRRCRELIERQLDEIFPGHGVSAGARIERLSLTQRQMVEIAQAAINENNELKLLILDEPTSALGRDSAEHLFAHLRRLKQAGVSTILISHKLAEILGNTDRTVVMRDGRVVAEQPTASLDIDSIVAAMGTTHGAAPEVREQRTHAAGPDTPERVRTRSLTTDRLRDINIVVRQGEIVGLSGLDGQGQQPLLLELWRRRRSRRGAVVVNGRMAFITGDRAAAGVFQLWPVLLNISVGAMSEVGRRGLIDPAQEQQLAGRWVERLKVRGSARTPILDLSGGNQQKALVARALASPAQVILLDDPFRGVDIQTRREVYRLMRQEAAAGRSFLWFTTENDELEECDRVYVMSRGTVAAELGHDEISEEAVVAASFAGT